MGTSPNTPGSWTEQESRKYTAHRYTYREDVDVTAGGVGWVERQWVERLNWSEQQWLAMSASVSNRAWRDGSERVWDTGERSGVGRPRCKLRADAWSPRATGSHWAHRGVTAGPGSLAHTWSHLATRPQLTHQPDRQPHHTAPQTSTNIVHRVNDLVENRRADRWN